MDSYIRIILRIDLDFSIIVIIFHKYRGIVDECPLDKATRFLPWLFFVVELKGYGKNNHFVNIYTSDTLFFNSLQIGWKTWCLNSQGHFPNTYPKPILSRNIYVVWSIDDQGREIWKTQPWWSIIQVKQSAFACSEVTFNRFLLK